jgi:hypothetical protein
MIAATVETGQPWCAPGGGFDRFFTACAEEFKKGEPEMPLLVKLAAEYGIEFQSGPPS